MGREAYLFKALVQEPIRFEQLSEHLRTLGFKKVNTEAGESEENNYFELNTVQGITEIHAYVEKGYVVWFYIRFALLNPNNVIEQTFQFFDEIVSRLKIRIIAVENGYVFNTQNRGRIKEDILAMKDWIERANGIKYDRPIRCNDVFDKVRELQSQVKGK